MKKYALITGASRGIGAAIASALAKEGFHLYLVCHHSRDAIFALKENLETSYQIDCECFIGDVSDVSFIEHCFSQMQPLDVLVNNAGISHIGLLSDMSIDEWHSVLNTNLSSAFYTCKYAIPAMVRKKSGRIINISSVWGNVGASMEVAYSASKGGLNSFTKALAKELAPSNVQVNAIACGVIDTDMNRCFSDEDLQLLKDEIPADYIAPPCEVADMVISLLSAPNYLTGQIINLDGGWQ